MLVEKKKKHPNIQNILQLTDIAYISGVDASNVGGGDAPRNHSQVGPP